MASSNDVTKNFPALYELSSLVQRASELGTDLRASDSKARKYVIVAARSRSLSLETPMEALLRMEWSEVSLVSFCFHISQTLNYFRHHFVLPSGLASTSNCLRKWLRAMAALRPPLSLQR